MLSAERSAHAEILPEKRDVHAGEEWTVEQLCSMASIARRFLSAFAHQRCDVAMLLPELDELAGRNMLRRAGPGMRYDTSTGDLVRTA